LKQAVHNVLDEQNEPPEERALFCDNNWLFDLAFLVNVNDHLNHLNIKLQGKNKLFLNLIIISMHSRWSQNFSFCG